jgi:CDP-6-deoxy-D-xylo-4-hexulose-3-dehydrase|tara:strand:- start:1647 stop:2849 length:1203 start_codon:yes stop_codon:yes gene_type:complete
MKIYYGKAIYGKNEIDAVNKVLKKNYLNLVDGPNVKLLENKIAKLFGKKHALMVNSGSSANLLGLASFNFKPGSEIITTTLTFSTTVAPIYQLGLVPSFIGVIEDKFIADVSQIEKCITKKTVAIMLPNLLGNIVDWKKVKFIAKKYNLKLIEDSADTIGYAIDGSNTGRLSDIVTNSFYASHIITGAGFGGIVCFNNKDQYNRAKLLRGWGRSSTLFNEKEDILKRFKTKVDGIPYDGKYIFSAIGYNFLPSEISAAFALEQSKKLKSNISTRIRNFKFLINFFKKYEDIFSLPRQNKGVKTGWLAFPLVIKSKKIKRQKLQIFLEKRNIQTRTIFTGNILRQPIMKKKKYFKHKKSEIVSNDIMRNGILIGCHHGLTKKNLEYICKSFNLFLKKNNLI